MFLSLSCSFRVVLLPFCAQRPPGATGGRQRSEEGKQTARELFALSSGASVGSARSIQEDGEANRLPTRWQDPVVRDATEFAKDSCTTRSGKKTPPSIPLCQNATPFCLPLPQNATPTLTDEKKPGQNLRAACSSVASC